VIDYNTFLLPQSDHYDSIPQDPRNPLTVEKVELGKLLFHETRLAGSPKFSEGLYTYSCASCHHAEAGFQSGLAQAISEGGSGFGVTGEARIPSITYPKSLIDVQPIRTPSVLNTAYQQVMLWNGALGATGVNANTQASWTDGFSVNNLGFQGLETLGFAAFPKHRLLVDTTFLCSNSTYKTMFDAAFADTPVQRRVTITTVSLAIAAYERVLLANQSPFQRWIRGDITALNADENAGRKLFFGKAKCGKCHTGPALNSTAFYALAMNDLQEGVNGVINIPNDPLENKGRGGFTNRQNQMYKFKVPQLYNLKDVHFFGHGASFTSVEEVVRYFNNAIPQNPNVPVANLPKLFVPLGLTDTEIAQIVKFVEDGLYDPNLSRYVPASVPSGNCIPNNDAQSKIDRGCN
jgi:cytochrome c peroxidase